MVEAALPAVWSTSGTTRLHVVERGEGHPILLLHGGPGLDHHEFGDYLDPLTDRYRLILVDQWSQGLLEVASVLHDQLPLHFADPGDPRIEQYERRTAAMVYAPAILRHFADLDYGAIEVEDRLTEIRRPVLVLAGRHDRICPVEAGGAIAARVPGAEFVVFEHSARMPFVEETESYVQAVRSFLERHGG